MTCVTYNMSFDDIRLVCHKLRLEASRGSRLLFSQRQALERLETVVGRMERSPDILDTDPERDHLKARVAELEAGFTAATANADHARERREVSEAEASVLRSLCVEMLGVLSSVRARMQNYRLDPDSEMAMDRVHAAISRARDAGVQP